MMLALHSSSMPQARVPCTRHVSATRQTPSLESLASQNQVTQTTGTMPAVAQLARNTSFASRLPRLIRTISVTKLTQTTLNAQSERTCGDMCQPSIEAYLKERQGML